MKARSRHCVMIVHHHVVLHHTGNMTHRWKRQVRDDPNRLIVQIEILSSLRVFRDQRCSGWLTGSDTG